MNTKVLFAVFRRNFVSYFASPLGYVFICVFVWLSVLAAFWTNEFFNTNLANLDQLNRWFPFIMLVFIPAITMGVWADERRQGTDELLLTIPASDFDVVLGKYLAAVAIYTVALLFSLVCTFFVLKNLGSPDLGLFLSTYLGYWLVGLAMLSMGMVASFLTGNLTVAFILGALFNAPLVFAVYSDSFLPAGPAMEIRRWSLSEQFREYGRGLVTLSGMAYFLMIAAVMLYLSMILIARRHWARGRDWTLQAGHYVVRLLALAVIIVAVNVFFYHHNVRLDASSEKLSSLAPQTVEILNGLELERPVQVEAFISPDVPESYVQTQRNLRTMLEELQARGGGKVLVQINRTEQFSEEAARAEKRFGITPRRVFTTTRGATSMENLFMGVSFNCGLQKVTLPFIDRGTPIEYELVHAIHTVAQPAKRKRVGVVQTDAPVFGRFNMQRMSSTQDWWIVDELKKAYEVVEVDATKPITEKYDVLLVVQPSSLGPEQMANFLAAVQSGQPTAIFEDPFPYFVFEVPGTSFPKRPPGGQPFMMNQGVQQKGDIRPLWAMLGVDFAADEIVYQQYNPYPKLARLPNEFVFVDNACGAREPFNVSDPISSGLQHVLLPFPGFVAKLNSSALEYTPLVRTGERTGTVRAQEAQDMFSPDGLNPNRQESPQGFSYVLAAKIQGKVASPPSKAGEKPDAKAAAKPESAEIKVVLVSDIDFLHPEFFRIREQGDIPDAGVHFDFDNVTFALNVVDYLAGEERFLEIRKRRPQHRTLTKIEQVTEGARKQRANEMHEAEKKFDEQMKEEQKNLSDKVADLNKQLEKNASMNTLDVLQRVEMVRREGQQRVEATRQQLKQELDKNVNRIETEQALEVRRVQDWYKFWAVALPPIPPLVVAAVFFVLRRAKEREGVARSRLR